jgi:GNAT superfamily N-acetyltransferase
MRTWIATPAEAPDVARLLAAFRSWYEVDEPSDAAFLASVERIIVDPTTTEFLLGAAGDGPPDGVVAMRFRHSVWTSADDCWIEDVYVADAARGTGLGRTLVRAALDHARARGCKRAELDVDDVNVPARTLYESLGFAEKHGGSACMGVSL